jgi:hypothetical protein
MRSLLAGGTICTTNMGQWRAKLLFVKVSFKIML